MNAQYVTDDNDWIDVTPEDCPYYIQTHVSIPDKHRFHLKSEDGWIAGLPADWFMSKNNSIDHQNSC